MLLLTSIETIFSATINIVAHWPAVRWDLKVKNGPIAIQQQIQQGLYLRMQGKLFLYLYSEPHHSLQLIALYSCCIQLQTSCYKRKTSNILNCIDKSYKYEPSYTKFCPLIVRQVFFAKIYCLAALLPFGYLSALISPE